MSKRYVITGGGGFVGRALGKALIQRGHSVVSIARSDYPELRELGIETHSVDISSDPRVWIEVIRGADGVFHTAAKVDMWGKYDDFFRVNVEGTRNVISVCKEAGVTNLVFTSSPSVIHDGGDLVGVDEAYPYPRRFDAWYPETKALAEQEVRAANNGVSLRTVSLRPHLIWGPGDTNLVPTILERAKVGRLTQIGGGKNLVDLTYIEDCVEAHILAMERLESNCEHVFGRVYFISQGDPVPMWDWISDVLVRNGLSPVTRSIPTKVAHAIAMVMEVAARVSQGVGFSYTPLLTRFLVSEMSTHHFFSIEAAKRDLGYSPSRSIAEALEATFPVV